MWIVTADDTFGPFCSSKRKRRAVYHDYDLDKAITNKNYKTEEMDLVFRNGQSIKMKFAFQFEFEFQPGMLGEDGMCSYRDITASNHYFSEAVHGHGYGYDHDHHGYKHGDGYGNSQYQNEHYPVIVWEQLTQSLYEFNLNYADYRTQCQSYVPVNISCNALKWEGKSWRQMLVQIKALINAQCSQCHHDGICKLWNHYFDNIKHSLDHYHDDHYDHHPNYDHGHGYHDKPYNHHVHHGYKDHGYKDYGCDEDQCAKAAAEYKDICPGYSKCVNKCHKYECQCNYGYTMTYGKCVKDEAYQAPAYTPKPVYTTKAPYKAPYKPPVYTTKPPYKPVYTTKPPYKPAYTTKKPYKPVVYTTKPYVAPPAYTGKPYDPPIYTNNHHKICPWWKTHYGDCGTKYPDRCSLKYFRVCGEHFFNSVYDDVCRWQDAKQLIPMFTAKLVPLGIQFENAFGVKCVGYGTHSHEKLYGRKYEGEGERDVAQCKPNAGAPSCEYLDFSHVTTARDFQHKMEHLYYGWLKHQCNKEWQVHFEALLTRMRNSLFCDDGTAPDHVGYIPSPPPPAYTPPLVTAYKPTEAPYKAPETPYKPSEAYNVCDDNQCAPRFQPCPTHAYCIDKCKGFSCVCHDGYTKVSVEIVFQILGT